MSAIATAAVLYAVLVVLLRIAGKRTLRDVTVFDLVLLLVISEATQQALTGKDHSLTQAATVVSALIAIDIVFSYLKHWSPALDRWLEGLPVVLVADGKVLRERLDRTRIDENDILQAAREEAGLERLEEIRWAVLERDGRISIVPASERDRQ
jgi:uncharacterized membrane protein YcaP (DUF421 family)